MIAGLEHRKGEGEKERRKERRKEAKKERKKERRKEGDYHNHVQKYHY